MDAYASTRNEIAQAPRMQRGSVAIEFAAVFAVFFVVLYAALAYSIPFMLQQSLKQVSADAARSAARIDPAVAGYRDKVADIVDQTVKNSWLPGNWYAHCTTAGPGSTQGYTQWQALRSDGADSYAYLTSDNSDPDDPRPVILVCLERKYNRSGAANETAIVPVLEIIGVTLPALPVDDNGDTILRATTAMHL
ncbi:TadE/TadG family type IV pilus assembly protein [Thauera sp.]|jgi:Flp pilus assembly protein TadG|uniref:TadE/TadG family type IV pilus assembly protein n=1 Tax=Thauera sp. TaxID=1905334 RepID=UPI002A358634|nr:TadE/TadG family type IV pilus assembly protein [Thauera sp.]MDX9884872.1 TadE/TadG family type IV pilus assembly protein [Thauera sp.]